MASTAKPQSSSNELPSNFLRNPGPEVIVHKVDFSACDLAEYHDLYAVVLDNVLTREECDTLVRVAESRTNGVWDQAMINVGGGHQMLAMDSRNCGRIIWDDRDVVERIWSRVKDSVPEIEYLSNAPKILGNGIIRRKETWRMSRLNERMRFLKYGAGQYFRPHMDGAFATPNNEEISFFTLHLYLNEADPTAPEGKLEGGATAFHSHNMNRSYDVDPKIGRVLIFQHRYLLHSGADVTGGIKYTMRTDIMYRKSDKVEI